MAPQPIWVDKLKPLVERDLFIRDALLQKGVLNDAYHPEMEKVHLTNARKLKELIEKEGFPVLSNAGEEGVRLSWLIIQHAISWPDFMKECLTQIRLAAADNDYSLELLAYTEDRVAFFEGRPQVYGTNWDWQNAELRPTPIADPDGLAARRQAVGLPPLDLDRQTPTNEKPPKDPLTKEREFQEWLLRVGWRV